MKKNKKRIIIIAAAAVALIVIAAVIFMPKGSDSEVIAKEYTVELGTIDSTISGQATIQPNDQYTVTSVVSGDVLSSYFEEGDIVTEGTVMYQIDSSDISKNIESSQLSLEKANMTYNTTLKDIKDLTMYSEHSGVVTNLTVKEGDTISNGQTIATVYDDSTMTLKIPFNETDADKLWVGASANVTLTDSSTTLYGNVVSIDSSSYALSGYMRVKDIEIKVTNPGSVKEGAKATAIVGNIACNSAGILENSVNEEIKATASGKIVTLNLKEKGRVNKGDVMIVLDSESLDTQKRNNEISIREAQLNQQKTLDTLDDYTITAPITGTVITKNVKAGDKLDNTGGATTLAIIYDMSSLKFEMDVDELDITKIAVGQEVIISADAFTGQQYTGYVEKVNINGTSSNGVTVYPVTVRINDFGELLPGMNIDAEIVIEKVENVMVVPTECINRGNTVYVKGDKESDDDTAPDGYKTVTVETGFTDSEYIEIISGLEIGDVVRGSQITINAAAEQAMGQQGMMGGGMMGGGMPGGGMMGGGMMGGGMPGGGGGMPGGMR